MKYIMLLLIVLFFGCASKKVTFTGSVEYVCKDSQLIDMVAKCEPDTTSPTDSLISCVVNEMQKDNCLKIGVDVEN